MSSLAIILGHELEQARKAAGESRRALAARLGCADTTLLGIETGRDNPTLRRIEELAAGYGVDITITVTPKDPTP